MRKLITSLCALMLFCTIGFAQTRKVTGKVTDADGKPVPFATVMVKGTKTALSADDKGDFSIDAAPNSTLIFSASGMQKLEVNIKDQTSITAVISSEGNMSEVVVTALGIRRNKNELPYAAQQVKGDEIAQSRGNNFVDGLSGRVSGLEIRQGNSMGGSTNAVIRGYKSLTQNNQALFVVDGMPFDNSNTNSTSQKKGGAGYDYGSSSADLNPDDIESVNVLKGAAATALYGSRASNGAIVITTKKGKRGLGITVNTGLTYGSFDKSTFTTYQKQYGAGYGSSNAYGSPDGNFFYFDANGDGIPDLVTPTTEDASWGAKFDPNLMVYQWNAFDKGSPYYGKATPWMAAKNDPTTFFENPLSNNNSVYVNGGDEKSSFKLGYTRNKEKGLLPNSNLTKNMIDFGATHSINNRLLVGASINFSKIDGLGRYQTGYPGDGDPTAIGTNFREWWQTNVDINELKDAYFRNKQNITWNWTDPSDPVNGLKPIYWDNPYWTRYQNYENDSRIRYFGNINLNYKATDWLNLLGRISLDTYNEMQEERIAVGSLSTPGYSRFNHSFSEVNYDFLANFDKNLSNRFNLKALLGTNIRKTDNSSIYAITNGGLVVPELYSLSNSINPINAPTEKLDNIEVDGVFAALTLTYNNLLSLDLTERRDRSSTLPEANNTYYYPSVSGSFQFYKLLPQLSWLSSGKLRANYAEVGNSAPSLSVNDVYSKPAPFGSSTLFTLPYTKNNNDLRPEKTKSYELGTEISLFKNRLGLDVTYYNAKSVDQILPVDVSYATGYIYKYVNSGTIENKGWEVSLSGSPVQKRNFSWNVNINWTRNRNLVEELFPGSDNLQLAGFQATSLNASLGQPYGTIRGKDFVYLNGQKVVKANGFYQITATSNNIIGNINPDWTGGIYNTLKYKNFSLGFLIDVRQGGDVFSLDMYYGLATGLYPETAGTNDLNNPVRNSIANGGGIIVQGVTADGKPNTKRVDISQLFGAYGYVRNPMAAFVYDASYIKLREMNLTYSLPQSFINKLKAFKEITISLIGRNLWIIHKNLPYSDPEELLSSGNYQGYQVGAYPTTRNIGFNLKFNL